MDWIIYALLAPLFWTFSNFIDKYSLDRYVANTYDFLFFSSLSSFVLLPILVLIFGLPTINVNSLIPIGLGISLIYSYGFYIKALEVNDTSRLVIMFKLIPVITLILGFIFLDQAISLKQFIAFCVVLMGAAIISLEKDGFRIKFATGTYWLLGAIFMWSGMFLVADWILLTMPFKTFAVLDLFGSAIAGFPLLLIPTMRTQVIEGLRSTSSAKFWWFNANGFLDTLGQLCIKKSLAIAPSAGLVSVVSQVQSFYAIMAGVILTFLVPFAIKEDVALKTLATKIVGAAIMFIGVYLIF